MTRPNVHALGAPVALNAVDDVERREFDLHLLACEDCNLEAREFNAVAVRLADGTAMEPPADRRDRVLARVDATPQALRAARPRRRRSLKHALRWLLGGDVD